MAKHSLFSFTGAVLLALLLAQLALGQHPQPQGPPPQQNKPKSPVKKVWTEEDLSGLRKPWDDYADQKPQAAPPPAAASSEEKPVPPKKDKPASRDEYIPPKTLEEAENWIAEKREEIRFQHEAIDRVRQDYANESQEQVRQELQKRLDRMVADLKDAEAELKLLEASRDDLKSKPQSEPKSAPN
jgi:hypothetical protein